MRASIPQQAGRAQRRAAEPAPLAGLPLSQGGHACAPALRLLTCHLPGCACATWCGLAQVDTYKGIMTNYSNQTKKDKLVHPITAVAAAGPDTLLLGCTGGELCLMQCPQGTSGNFALQGTAPSQHPVQSCRSPICSSHAQQPGRPALRGCRVHLSHAGPPAVHSCSSLHLQPAGALDAPVRRSYAGGHALAAQPARWHGRGAWRAPGACAGSCQLRGSVATLVVLQGSAGSLLCVASTLGGDVYEVLVDPKVQPPSGAWPSVGPFRPWSHVPGRVGCLGYTWHGSSKGCTEG